MEKHDFFISYAAADRPWAEWAAWVLEEAGYTTVVQSWDFRPGANFVLEMHKAAASARQVLALLSPDYLSNRQPQAEWAAAFAEDPVGGRGRLVPVRIRSVELEGLLAQIVYIDLVGLDEQQARKSLLRGLDRNRAKPLAAPGFPASARSLPEVRSSPRFPSETRDEVLEIPLDRMPPSPPPPGSRIPLPPNPDFIGREDEIRAIARCFGKEFEDSRVVLLRGAGGIGKTALAAEFAHRYGRYFTDGVQWVNCADEPSIPAEIASHGGASGLRLRPDFENLPLGNQVRLVREAWSNPLPRLLVFDSCEDQKILDQWLPQRGGGRILVTSRSLDCEGIGPRTTARVLTLGPISAAQGIVLLRRCANQPSSEEGSLAALSAELEGLPLALHLAGALLRGQLATEFLRKLRQERARLQDSLQSTLAWSLEQAFAELKTPGVAASLAHLLALRAGCFAPSEPIPLRLLAAAVEKSEDDSSLQEALNRLECVGLVVVGDSGVTLHPWVVAWLREKARPEDLQAAERAVYLELKRGSNTNESGSLLGWQAHLRAITNAAKDREDLPAARLCEAFAEHLRGIGDREESVIYLDKAVSIREKLGQDDVELAEILESLGSLLVEGGGMDLVRARDAYERARQIRIRQEESSPLARVLYNLGLIAQSRGERELARQYLENSLSMWERLSGPNASDTMAVRHQLQFILGEQGLAEKEFLQAVPWAASLLGRLRGDGASLRQVKVIGPNRWVLHARIPDTLQEAYGIAPEVLLLVVHGEVKGQDLLTAQQELGRKDTDVDPDLLVVVDDHPKLDERLDRLPSQWGQWIPWQGSGSGFPELAARFREFLPLYDVFEQRDPVRGHQVIGRNEIVSDLRKRIQRGQAVGIFGLRKVGKTTVVRAATDWLDPFSAHRRQDENRASVLVAWLDMERLTERTLESVTASLRKDIERRLAIENGAARKLLSEGEKTDLGLVLEAALDRTDLSICVVLDEYDLLFEGRKGQPAIQGVESLFRVFRAMAQQTGRLSLVVIGRDPGFFENPEMNGWPNPMLNWVIPRWLGPLSSEDANDLLVKLGRRVLLEVGPETAARAYQWTGGHPLLHRQFGSALLEKRRQQKSISAMHVATDAFCREALDLFLARDAVTTICREVSHLLSTRYPAAAALLDELCSASSQDGGGIVEGQGGWLRPEARLLRNFGVLLGDSGEVWVPEVFRWYLRGVTPQAQGRRA